MRRCCYKRTHLVEDDSQSRLCELPCCFRAGETAANDMNSLCLSGCHRMINRALTGKAAMVVRGSGCIGVSEFLLHRVLSRLRLCRRLPLAPPWPALWVQLTEGSP